jgi:hypothetical protein
MLKKSMEDISNKTAVRDTNVNNDVSAWNACQPNSKKYLDALTSDEWRWEWVSLFFARPLDHHSQYTQLPSTIHFSRAASCPRYGKKLHVPLSLGWPSTM